jgi:uncharacterized protein (TIGR02271 family)
MATTATKTAARTTAVGVFRTRDEAQRAVTELRRLGFKEADIGVASRDGKTVAGATKVKDAGSKAATGAAAGVATGAGVGALWGLGILSGLIPGIGPAIAGGTLGILLSSAAAGAAAAGLAGALIGLGLSETEAKYYEKEFRAGRTIVTVKAGRRYDEAVAVLRRFGAYDHETRTATTGGTDRTVELRSERLNVGKETDTRAGEVRLKKRVRTEHKEIEVPVESEEVVIERRPVRRKAAGGSIGAEEVRIPVSREKVKVGKETVVREEVKVGKRKVTGTRKVEGDVRREELVVESDGRARVRQTGGPRKPR